MAPLSNGHNPFIFNTPRQIQVKTLIATNIEMLSIRENPVEYLNLRSRRPLFDLFDIGQSVSLTIDFLRDLQRNMLRACTFAERPVIRVVEGRLATSQKSSSTGAYNEENVFN
jgi:hypothetical protein